MTGQLSGTSPLDYGLGIDPAPTSSTIVYYVNSTTTVDDYYTLAPGNDSNSGLDPAHPKASLQSLLASYALGPNALVLIDTGNYDAGSTITLSGGIGNQGAAYAGSPGGSVLSDWGYWGNVWELIDSSYNLFYGLDVACYGNSGFYAHPGATASAASTNNTFLDDTFSGGTAITINGGGSNTVEGNTFQCGTAVSFNGDGSDTIEGNTIAGTGSNGIVINGGVQEVIEDNTISGQSTAIYVNTRPWHAGGGQ